MARGGLRKVEELDRTVLNGRAIHTIHSNDGGQAPTGGEHFGQTRITDNESPPMNRFTASATHIGEIGLPSTSSSRSCGRGIISAS
jgi:hypothetical protein